MLIGGGNFVLVHRKYNPLIHSYLGYNKNTCFVQSFAQEKCYFPHINERAYFSFLYLCIRNKKTDL